VRGASLCMIHRENSKNLAQSMQLHGVLDMKARFPINCSIIFVKEQGKSFLNIFKI
jgi:hypothetical protein